MAAKAAGIVAAAGLAGWAVESNVTGEEGNGAAQSRLCAQTRAAAERMPAEARAGARRAADAACEAGFRSAPTARSVSRPNFVLSDGTSVVTERSTTVPLRARRAGRLPNDGVVSVGGVRLPRGSRRDGYWTTAAPAEDAVDLADRLARAFPKTGLWPVLWDWEESAGDFAEPTAPRGADGVDVRDVLGRRVLARGGSSPVRRPAEPFAQLLRSGGLETGSATVILVAVRRPADAIAAIGAMRTEVATPAQLTAVARSWERRFGAVLVKLGPSDMAFSVASPPRSREQVRALAAEQLAFAPEGGPGDVAAVARALSRDTVGDGETSPGFWVFGWPD